MLDVVYRNGDVVQFRRGSNEYVGTIIRIYGVVAGLRVRVEPGVEQVAPGHRRVEGYPREMTVMIKDVQQIVVPVLTAKERVAIEELSHESVSVTVSDLNGTRRATVPPLPLISGTTLYGLSQRGLVTGEHYNIASASGPFLWRLTLEGRRVAAL